MKIALVSGAWSSNIGNAFYNLGGEFLLKKLGVGDVFFVPETPRWRVHDLKVKDFDITRYLDVDLVILNGPCFFHYLIDIFEETFNVLTQRGVRIGFISSGMSIYSDEEANKICDFLNRYKPLFIATRDRETYHLLNGKINNCEFYDGICTSMFLNDAVKIPDLKAPEYYVYNFDATHEPIIYYENGEYRIKPFKKKWFERKRQLPTHLNGKDIIRTSNNGIDSPINDIYFTDNTYHSDLPYGYISILKNAEMVFSERVHTCATALIMGNTAQFIPVSQRSFDNRSNLFRRLNAEDIFHKPIKLNFEFVDNEKNKLEKFLRDIITHNFNIQ